MSTLGAPQKLGDIDVMALSSEGCLVCIECKNLQMAKTISEVADVCNRFKGHGKKDELKKVLCAIALLFSTSVNATLIDHGDYVQDTASGLEWLKLDVTIGLWFIR